MSPLGAGQSRCRSLGMRLGLRCGRWLSVGMTVVVALMVAASLFTPMASTLTEWANEAERKRADFYQMWVAPEARGRGLGGRLVGRALEWATSVGAACAVLDVTAGDSAATRLYERHGFVATGPAELLDPDRELLAVPMEIDLTVRASSSG